MKKLRQSIALLFGLGMMTFGARPAQSANNLTVDVVMTIQTLDVTLLNGTTAFTITTLPNGVKRVPPEPVNVRNTGNFLQDYQVKTATASGNWTTQETTGALSVNQYRLRGVWAVFGATLAATVPGSWGDNDIITTSNQTSSATKFFAETESSANVGLPADQGGYNVAANGPRSLHLLYEAGPVGTTGSATARLTVTAIASQ